MLSREHFVMDHEYDQPQLLEEANIYLGTSQNYKHYRSSSGHRVASFSTMDGDSPTLPSQGLNDVDSESEIYYSNNGREKYRSVLPPTTPHERLEYRPIKYGRSIDGATKHLTSKGSVGPEQISKSQNHVDVISNTRNTFFELATSDDCFDRNVQWPLIAMETTREAVAVAQQQSYFTLALPDAPIFLQITHFYLGGRCWTSIEDDVLRILSSRKTHGLVWEYRKPEFLWICSFAKTIECTFQIRAYVDISGANIVIEMQRLTGSASSFSQLYHILRNELSSTIVPALSSSGSTEEDDEETSEDNDCNIEFLLIPVLEMMQSDYPEMQLEALKMACELSSTTTSKCTDEYQQTSEEYVGCAYSSESARNQMRGMGYLSILIDIACRWHEIDYNQNCPNNYFPLIGCRAITTISNLSTNQVFSELLSKCEKAKEFSQLLSRISESGAQSDVHLQNICRELLSLC